MFKINTCISIEKTMSNVQFCIRLGIQHEQYCSHMYYVVSVTSCM